MANKNSTQQNTTPNLNQIFNDLEKYLEFCVEYGYRFNESELYDPKSYVFRQFNKYITGKPAKNNWELDAKQE
jgi:hypothetical protein